MASEDSSMINSSYDDTDDGFHYQTRQNSLSRLSICTSSFHDDENDNFIKYPSDMGNFISESFADDGAEADGEISDDSDSDKDSTVFYPLPTIISRRRRKTSGSTGLEKEKEIKTDASKQRRGLRERKKRYEDGEKDMKKPMIMGFDEVKTSSGGNSPIANWRISSPGDDPKDVKARLKMWAQAVAFLASASR